MKFSLSSVTLPILLAATTVLSVAALAADPPAASVPIGHVVAAHADTPAAPVAATPQIDDAAMALLQKVQTTMAGLKTYRAECVTTTKAEPTADGKQRAPSATRAIVVSAKPNLLHVDRFQMAQDASGTWTQKSETPYYIQVGDGKNTWMQSGKTYRTAPYKSPDQLALYGDPWAGFYAGDVSPYGQLQADKKQGNLIEVRNQGDETVDGVSCQKALVHTKLVSGDQTYDIKTTWYIGPDSLVHRKTYSVDSKQLNYAMDSTVKNIKVDEPVADSATLFAYTPPADVKLYVPRPQPALLANGVAAPEITAVDKEGATVKLSDFKGKVVVVDFWASWCPPCKASMPHNQEITKKLQDANVPMVLLAVDNGEDQPAFAKWVAEHPEYASLKFVYADPKTHSVSGDDYHVSGIPTQYVIDANGIIRASFVGYGGPTDDMENAVRAALAGTSKVASK